MMSAVKYVVVALLLIACGEASAQQMKERGWVRRGNRQYAKEKIERSIESYQEALRHDPSSFEAKYDLASALYRAERYEKAEQTLLSIVNDESRSEEERGEVAYNLGNTQFAQKKYKEALSSYRKAMRCNPDDEDAKFNYAFTKRLLQQQEQQQQQNQDQNQDQNQQNQDQNQDKQDGQNDQNKNDQNQDKNNENKDNQNQQQSQPQQGKDEQQGGEQPQSAISPEQQEALLQAIQAEEDKTQDKLKEKAGVLIRGGKNW
jgi:tetratricopeptide (TPR) repeat protein